MRLLLIPIIHLACLTVAIAIPPVRDDDSPMYPPISAPLPIIVNQHYVPNGPAALAAAYAKWQIPVPQGLLDQTLVKRGDSSGVAETISVDADSYWTTEIYVGGPDAQTLPVIIDTGSSDFWVVSTDTDFQNNAKNGIPKLYDPSKSPTSTLIKGSTWDVKYSDGSTASGKVYTDDLRLGNPSTTTFSLSLSDTIIQSATSVSRRLAIDPNLSGVLGLAKFQPSSVQPSTPTTVEHLMTSLKHAYIAVDLRHNSSSGFWDFGTGNGPLALSHEPPVPDSAHWDFLISRFRMNSMPPDVWWNQPAPFIATADTGTSLLLLPGNFTAAYYAEIPGSVFDPMLEAYLFPCDLASGIPDWSFATSSGYEATVPKEYLNFGPIPGDDGKCFGAIQSSRTAQAVFGGTVLKTLYVQFNYADNGRGWVSLGPKSIEACSLTESC
ncbi:Penicillopepsin-1 [Colletotrichum spinosum]|uniref:Penicillopepsin-1 n=1 Tax=Colletotrichum spinosum TaxID=1347390 RepID=A0A4R8Q3E7_9PEZI|nr:Penicillopepsin-1 [Colletotrichum spinosum]